MGKVHGTAAGTVDAHVRRSSFLVRWVLAVLVAMLVAGIVEYGLAARQFTETSLDETTKDYQDQARELEAVLASEVEPGRRALAVRAELGRLTRSRGVVQVKLFDAAGRLVRGTELDAVDYESVDQNQLAQQVVSTGRPLVADEADEGEAGGGARHMFFLPVRAPEGLLVLMVDQRTDAIRDLVADMRVRKMLELLVAVLLALPLSYVLGGRSLHRQQVRAEREADSDALTGLAGRRPFRPVLDAAWRGGFTTQSAWPCSTSTASSRSTTVSGTALATECSSPWPTPSACCARPNTPSGSGAMSSPSSCPACWTSRRAWCSTGSVRPWR